MESDELYLSNLNVIKDSADTVYVELVHYNHLDYVEDVLVEKFNFESFSTQRENPYRIYVFNEFEFCRFYEIIALINLKHTETNELYKTV